jgi:DNA-binding MarR family transcriptional regulator
VAELYVHNAIVALYIDLRERFELVSPDDPAVELVKGQGAVVDAVLAASRVFVAVASHALAGTTPQVTLPQFRALVLLDQHGVLSVAQLAAELGVVPSTASRMCDRLVSKKLVHRAVDRSNRRQMTLRLLPAGQALIAESTRRRKREISRLLRSISPADQNQLATSLDLLVKAAST